MSDPEPDVPTYLKGYRPWLWLILLCAALYVPGMAALPATDRDESRFMQASRQMLETGDFVRIRFMHEARNKKPAGIHWLHVAAVSLTAGKATVERWPYRIPSALGALAAVLLLFAAGQTLFDRRTAFLAAALLGSAFILVFEAHIAKTDAVLLATVMAAQYPLLLLFKAARDDEPAPGWAPYLLWIALGLSLLIKGPIGPFVVALTAVGLWLTRHWRSLWRDVKPLIGVPIMVAIAAPWFVAIIFADPDFVRESAGHDFFKKLISGQEAHGAPPGYYIVTLLLTFAPGSLFMWPALWRAWRQRREPEIAVCLLWLLPFWLVLEIVPTKLPHYILPSLPALALLTARAALAVEEGLILSVKTWWMRAGFAMGGGAVVIFAAVVVGLVHYSEGTMGYLFLWPPVVLVSVLWIMRRIWRADLRGALLLAACTAPLFHIALYQWGLPGASLIWPSRGVAAMVDRAAPDRATRPALISTGYREPSLVFGLGTATEFAEPPEMVPKLKARAAWFALVGADKQAQFLAEAQRRELTVHEIDRVSGYNYSNGRRVMLTLYGSQPRRQ